jgi:hypothetical protein
VLRGNRQGCGKALKASKIRRDRAAGGSVRWGHQEAWDGWDDEGWELVGK